jgi:hypothetical protein
MKGLWQSQARSGIHAVEAWSMSSWIPALANDDPSGGNGMTAQPVESGPDTGSYEVIHLGGQAAVVVPMADFLRVRALEQAASPQELEDAEDTTAVLE